MSSFMTKQLYQQINEVNSKLNELRRTNMEILKDQINNPEFDVASNAYKSSVEQKIHELEKLLSISIQKFHIIMSVTASDSSKKKIYGNQSQAFKDWRKLQIVKEWKKYQKSVDDHAKYNIEHDLWLKNEQAIQKFNIDIADIQSLPQIIGEDNNAYQTRIIEEIKKYKKKHRQPKKYDEPDQPAPLLQQPNDPLPPIPTKEIENIGLTTIPQIIDFRKAWAFFIDADFRFKIIYEELLQFQRYLNRENTKILHKLLIDLKNVYDEFISKFFYLNADGEYEQLIISTPQNYGANFAERLSKNADFIFDLFNTYYYAFDDIVTKAQTIPGNNII